jgi:hypothetical protein
MAPAQVGEIVLEAIRDDKFWVLTTDEFDVAIQLRMESILNRTNPLIQGFV